MVSHLVETIWLKEPDFEHSTYTPQSLECRLFRNPETKTWCGYVRLPADHPHATLRRAQAAKYYRIHGGITWLGKPLDQWDIMEGTWLGFDCAHAGDYLPGIVDMWHEMQLLIPSSEKRIDRLMKSQHWYRHDIYRTIAYARKEVHDLAEQVYLHYLATAN